MSEVKTIGDESRGPLSQITDGIVRKEIGKLWSVLEGRGPATGKAAQPHTFATIADITRLEASLTKRMGEIQTQSRQVVQSAGGAASAGRNLLTLNNIWTGTNDFRRPVTVQTLDAGQLLTVHPTIMLPTNVIYTVDVQRTTDVSSGTPIGGAVALLVQHRAQGAQPAGTAVLTSGIRCQVESRQTGAELTVNDVVSGYFGLLNGGENSNGFGLHVDAYHRTTGNQPNTYGVSVEMYGSTFSQTGKVVGYLLRSAGTATYNRRTDYGFLASPDTVASQSASRIETAFSAGSDWIGALHCGIAFDAAHARPDIAAFRLRSGDKLIFDGPTGNSAYARFNTAAGALELSGGGPVVRVRRNGDLFIDNGDLVINQPSTRTGPSLPESSDPTGLKHFGYFRVRIGPIDRWVPFYGYYT